jgi:DNA-binding MarR family transcriptional regulator
MPRPSNPSRSAPRPAPAVEDQEQEPATRVLQQFRIIFNAVKSHFQQVERVAGIGGASVWALSVIRERPGIGVSDLGAALHVRQPTASNLVKSLSRQALIDVRRSDADRRAVHLHVTAEGRKVLRRSPGPFAGVLPDALAQMEPRALLALERSLGALIEYLHADEAGAQTPLAQL